MNLYCGTLPKVYKSRTKSLIKPYAPIILLQTITNIPQLLSTHFSPLPLQDCLEANSMYLTICSVNTSVPITKRKSIISKNKMLNEWQKISTTFDSKTECSVLNKQWVQLTGNEQLPRNNSSVIYVLKPNICLFNSKKTRIREPGKRKSLAPPHESISFPPDALGFNPSALT